MFPVPLYYLVCSRNFQIFLIKIPDRDWNTKYDREGFKMFSRNQEGGWEDYTVGHEWLFYEIIIFIKMASILPTEL